MIEPRVVQQHYPPQPLPDSLLDAIDFCDTPPTAPSIRRQFAIRPSGRPGFNAPRAATFFLGKDHERWRRDERDRFGLGLGWARIASLVSSHGDRRSSRGALSSYSSGSDDDLSADETSSATSGPSFRSRSSRNSFHSRRSSRRPSEAISPPLTPFDPTSTRPRRFSSNGPEAAFLRHETVIGIHTPRRRSSAGSDGQPALRPLAQIRPPSGTSSKVDVPSSPVTTATHDKRQKEKSARKAQDRADKERVPKKKASIDRHKQDEEQVVVEPELARKYSKDSFHETLDLDEAARPALRRLRSNLEEAAAAAAASTRASPVPGGIDDDNESVDILRSSLSDAALDGKGPMSATDLRTLVLGARADKTGVPRAVSPRAPALKLAPRKKPEMVEGTLYDKTGPHREGAVTDGLSVRLFSSEDKERQSSFDDADLSNPEHPATAPWGRRGSSSSTQDDSDALYMKSSRRPSSAGAEHSPRRGSMNSDSSSNANVEPDNQFEEEGDAGYHAARPKVYLITTPDNRVSSAAKLRRWAMDGEGNFYAAMEIKTVEAKLRAADPAIGPATRELARELKETYLEDILDEVQKAETLNPSRSGAVCKVLMTEDGRYIRLEQDYPEESFFVIAGCEEDELYPVIVYIFVQAIRVLSTFHASGWMHGDVKLENLMFDETGKLVVIDYENANPYRGIPGGDGTVQLVSYDWIPPEASPGPMGRRMGPSGDLWALGCNLIRAFALRDGIEDLSIREMLLGSGQKRFLDWTSKLIRGRQPNGETASMPPAAFDIDFDPIFADATGYETGSPAAPEYTGVGDQARDFCDAASTGSGRTNGGDSSGTSSILCDSTTTTISTGSATELPTPAHLLYRFARSAPELLNFVLTRCVVGDPSLRGPDAEVEGMRLATWFEEPARAELLEVGRKAVDQAIELSGSVWVRPRLDEARKSLGLD